MTTLYRDPQGAFTLPETLRQGQNFTDPYGRQGVVNFDSLTGKPLAQGGTTYSRPLGSAPFVLPTNAGGGGSVPQGPTNNNPTTVSFTQALIQMLKEAQGRNTTGQASLMKQSQGITGLGLNDATRNFSNPMLRPNDSTSLGLSAQNEFDPLQLSIANQQKLASQNLGNITDVLKQTSTDYSNEQDRILQAARDAETIRSHKADEANPTGGFNAEVSIPQFTKNFESIKGLANANSPGGDNYVDPSEWIAARTLWGINGGSDSSFVSNFKKYLNPKSYTLAGIKETLTEEEKTQAIIDSLFQ